MLGARLVVGDDVGSDVSCPSSTRLSYRIAPTGQSCGYALVPSGGVNMNPVLARVARGAADLCPAEVAAITIRTKDPDRLLVVDVFGTGRIVEGILPTQESLNGMVVTKRSKFSERRRLA